MRLTISQSKAIETLVNRTLAGDLERTLCMRLLNYGAMHDNEQEDLWAEFAEQSLADDPFEGMDVDEFDADSEGDFSEELGPPETLEDMGLGTFPGPDLRADVVVERLTEGASSRLIVRSGISDLMLGLRDRDALTSAYHRFVRQRIVETLAIADRVVRVNRGFFLQQAKDFATVRRADLLTELQMKKDRLSRLLSAATLLAPWGCVLPLRGFVARSIAHTTEAALLQVFAEHSDEDHQKPLTDTQLTQFVNVLIRGRGPLGRTAVNEARKRLGVPAARGRKARYVMGMDLVDMVFEGQNGQQRVSSLLEYLQRIVPELRNEAARSTAQGWQKQAQECLSGR